MEKIVHKEAKSKNRIGILTFQCADNFGAMLQAYGLLTWLNEQGLDAFMINYVPPVLRGREWFFPYIPDRRSNSLVISRFKNNVRTGKDWWIRRRLMKEFRRKYLTHGSLPMYSSRQLSRVKADLLVVGSDQIWNPEENFGFLPAYFGVFKNCRAKKIVAYAASFGTALLPEKDETEFARLLTSVHEISMREESAAQYIEKRFRRKAFYVCDPVFLLRADQWRSLKDCPTEKGYILYYEGWYSESLRREALQFAKEKNMRIIWLAARREKKHWPFQTVYAAGPVQFLGYVDEAEFVITNSFHALAFSVLFHKPFYADNNFITGARIESLMQSIGLYDRLTGENRIQNIEEGIDWGEVERRLEVLREQSKEFLLHSLRLP